MTEPLKLITQPESWRAAAAPSVIEELEDLLEKTKAGEIVGFAFAAETIDGMTITCVTKARHRGLLLGALSQVQYRLNKAMDDS